MSELFKKIWNPINFKSHVSPHELLQAISLKSKKRFTIGNKSDPMKFLVWLLNTVHHELKDKKNECKLDQMLALFFYFLDYFEFSFETWVKIQLICF